MPDPWFCAPVFQRVSLFEKELLFSVLGRTFLVSKVERIGTWQKNLKGFGN